MAFDSIDSEDLTPLLTEFAEEADIYDQIAQNYRSKACNDRGISKLKRARKSFMHNEDVGKNYFAFNRAAHPFVSSHYYHGLKFDSVHAKYLEQMQQEAEEVQLKQMTLIGAEGGRSQRRLIDPDDLRRHHWLTLGDTCCKGPGSFINCFCTACNLATVLRLSHRKFTLAVAIMLFIVTTFGIFVPLVLPFGFYFGAVVYNLAYTALHASYDYSNYDYGDYETHNQTLSTISVDYGLIHYNTTIAPFMDLNTLEGKLYLYSLSSLAVLTLLCWVLLSVVRNKFRANFGITPQQSILSDMFYIGCCTSCAAKQMAHKAQKFHRDVMQV